MQTELAVPARSTLITEVERQSRRLGLPLATSEILREHPKLARDFLRAVREGRARRFLDSLDVAFLERALADREARGPRVAFGALVLF